MGRGRNGWMEGGMTEGRDRWMDACRGGQIVRTSEGADSVLGSVRPPLESRTDS
jgi:hypothetical protein